MDLSVQVWQTCTILQMKQWFFSKVFHVSGASLDERRTCLLLFVDMLDKPKPIKDLEDALREKHPDLWAFRDFRHVLFKRNTGVSVERFISSDDWRKVYGCKQGAYGCEKSK